MTNYCAPTPFQGWQCPICKAVMSPTCQSCINCKGNSYQTVSGGILTCAFCKGTYTLGVPHTCTYSGTITLCGN